MSSSLQLLDRYWPSECRAILVHKYFLGIERGYNPPLEEVVDSWERRFATEWRTKKIRRDAEAQIREIEAYRQRLCVQRGQDVDFRSAARDWVVRCEPVWRQQWEDSELACP